MKTNRGKIFVVTFTDPKEENGQSYLIHVYAVNEAHARQIFKAAEPEAIITEVIEDVECISEHYGPSTEGND